jgi:hypothetical protein
MATKSLNTKRWINLNPMTTLRWRVIESTIAATVCEPLFGPFYAGDGHFRRRSHCCQFACATKIRLEWIPMTPWSPSIINLKSLAELPVTPRSWRSRRREPVTDESLQVCLVRFARIKCVDARATIPLVHDAGPRQFTFLTMVRRR